MHLLAATPGEVTDGTVGVDLGQTPGDIVVLTAADTEIACLAAAQRRRVAQPGTAPSLRLANLLQLGHHVSVDLYLDTVVQHAKLVVVRLLGGRGYWPYGVDEIAAVAEARRIPVAFLPGDDQPDAELSRLTSLAAEPAHRLWQYLVHGGIDNAVGFLAYAASLIGVGSSWREPAPLVRAGLYWPSRTHPTVDDLRREWRVGAPVAAIVFYRALVQAAQIAPVDALMRALAENGLNPLPIFATSLKDPVAAETIRRLFEQSRPELVLNATGFALGNPAAGSAAATAGPFESCEGPVLQVVFSGGSESAWRSQTRGLAPRDIAMNVALPEVDGRVLTRAVSFKGLDRRDPLTEADIAVYRPVDDRVRFTARLAARWSRLRRTPPPRRRIAVVLANYPNRDGRLGNGVGLDTPASTIAVLRALESQGYDAGRVPADGEALVRWLAAGPTNAGVTGREVRETLALDEYRRFFAALPAEVRDQVSARWGEAEDDPFFVKHSSAFAVPAGRLGAVAVGVQPARGYNIDPVRSYHDPALVPPHGYFAFYAWLRDGFGADAVVHMGKHGNLEWLPGKALALSECCYPEAVLGPMPHVYPFIVNDPGEGTQAKRRAQAVIVDHLTPPLTRAGTYGALGELERLVDEYYEAANLDPRRLPVLRRRIVELTESAGIDRDLGLTSDTDEATALARLDGYLCELKEMQIKDGLHVFGKSPDGSQLTELLAALVRSPRGAGGDRHASLTRALARDLDFEDFDPLDCDMAAPWTGPRPHVLADGPGVAGPWRTTGDTVERLEGLAAALIAGERKCEAAWTRTLAVLAEIDERLRPAVLSSGPAEMAGLQAALDGRFVEPGPSGAPTRGRPEVLPTGRNFFSVDTRTVPTPAAWHLGWRSAGLLVERHAQEHGEWPRSMAISAWGTSNMRTGGDDIAQALALIGARPTWDQASGRVTGFEILPASVLGRPRVDVTLRVSGFFRDAFPNLIELFDAAIGAVGDRTNEDPHDNPIAERMRTETASLTAGGLDPDEAARRARWRIFGARPGAYGAGLQALIDERGWESEADLARAYVAWGGYAYGGGGGDGSYGVVAHATFERRLASVEAVVQNQDNREHDLLDSDDYYQFEGGLAAAVRVASGRQPAVYHNDHSRPCAPKVRALEDEIARVLRARVVNPRWIAGVMRHGYKGAFEMAATVDYLFAFAVTAHAVRSDQFDMVYAAYLEDDAVRDFLDRHNPAALREMAERFLEAERRGYWQPRSNSAHARLGRLAAGPQRDEG
ncbi:MAG: cobaltochelatase subunit CobN [Alphaproteobacteria bacterium]